MSFDIARENVFREALDLCLKYEGGYTNDPTDSGGETNYGIIHEEYDEYRTNKGLSKQSVRFISMEEVKDIYFNKYWLGSGCDKMSRRIAISTFDWQVNSGRGVTTLQKCLGETEDGIVGPKTINELKYWLSRPTGEERLLHNYFEFRECCYRRWGRGDQECFLEGWLNRSEDLKRHLQVS